MSKELKFNNRVVVVTGAGGGLGREYALMFARRGAKVVVNDLGGGAKGDGASSSAADLVVEEIRKLGGEAVANYDSVENGEAVIQTALDAYGTVDVLINNAGILRDVSFHKMDETDWDLIQRVHLNGSMSVSKAAWSIMRENNYGRIIMTASAAGIYGNFGQANYSAAKLGLLGLGQTLALEGASKNIRVNTIAPIAASRLTETVLPESVLQNLSPEYVSPLVGWLCHEDCQENGGLFEIGAGLIHKLRWHASNGIRFRAGAQYTVEQVASRWDDVVDFDGGYYLKSLNDSFELIMDNINNPRHGGNEYLNLDKALAAPPMKMESAYTSRDVSLYALGIGVGSDPLATDNLQYLFERGNEFHVLPTYGVMPALNGLLAQLMAGNNLPGMNVDFNQVLHGEQYTEIKAPLPAEAKLNHEMRLIKTYDKGRDALGVIAVDSFDEHGNKLIYNEITLVLRGCGGWGGDRGSSEPVNQKPDRAPDAVVEEQIGDNQALIYRLSGDWNPLHIDPAFAKNFGFDRPILHGLCTYGYIGRHAIETFLGNDPRRFKSIEVRFAQSVYPGETLVTSMWKESDNRIIIEAKVKERDEVVIQNAAIEFYDDVPELPKAANVVSGGETQVSVSTETVGSDVFNAIKVWFEKDSSLARSTDTVFQFNLADPDSVWTLDMKAGVVQEGTPAQADCTLTISESDFLSMSTGGEDPQQLYFAGKLKIAGNVMASAKLEFLKTLDQALVEAARTERTSSGGQKQTSSGAKAVSDKPKSSRAETVFTALAEKARGLSISNEALSGKVISIEVNDPESSWTLDLTGASPVLEASEKDSDLKLIIADEDVEKVMRDGASIQSLYQHGQVYIHGELSTGIAAIEMLRTA